MSVRFFKGLFPGRKRLVPLVAIMGVALLLLPLGILLGGCGGSDPEPALTTKKLAELYPGELENVARIEIRSGSTGQLVRITDAAKVAAWLREVREMEFVPDPNQEDRTGFLYAVSLFEHQDEAAKLSFTPSSTGGHYYLHNEELRKKIEALFEDAQLERGS